MIGESIEYEEICGVYFLLHMGEVVYIGQSVNVRTRVSAHQKNYGEKKPMKFDDVRVVRADHHDLDLLEMLFITKYRPRYNVIGNKGTKQCPVKQSNMMLKEGFSVDDLLLFCETYGLFHKIAEPTKRLYKG